MKGGREGAEQLGAWQSSSQLSWVELSWAELPLIARPFITFIFTNFVILQSALRRATFSWRNLVKELNQELTNSIILFPPPPPSPLPNQFCRLFHVLCPQSSCPLSFVACRLSPVGVASAQRSVNVNGAYDKFLLCSAAAAAAVRAALRFNSYHLCASTHTHLHEELEKNEMKHLNRKREIKRDRERERDRAVHKVLSKLITHATLLFFVHAIIPAYQSMHRPCRDAHRCPPPSAWQLHECICESSLAAAAAAALLDCGLHKGLCTASRTSCPAIDSSQGQQQQQ